MTTVKLIPMETQFNWAPGMHRQAVRNTAGKTEEDASLQNHRRLTMTGSGDTM